MRRILLGGLAALAGGCSALVTLDGLTGGAGDAGPDVIEIAETGADVVTVPDAAGDVHQPGCPTERGSTMVRVGDWCIDAYEATGNQYLAFLSSATDGGVAAPPSCQWKTSWVPDSLPSDLEQPVATVDWCDAWAFCAWAGKQLCGGMDGGAIGLGDFADPKTSLWMKVCTKDGALKYPYGNNFDISACNVGMPDAGGALAKGGQYANCNGGYAGVFDMVGNVKEWENACSASSGRMDQCRRRSGSFNDQGDNSGCAFDNTMPRDFRYPSTGIRCCSPVR